LRRGYRARHRLDVCKKGWDGVLLLLQ